MSLLSDFFLVGQKQNASGSFAQAKLKVFSSFANSILDTILDQINNVLIPKLFRMNGEIQERYPQVYYYGTEGLDLTSIMLWIQSAHKTGTLTPTVDTENYIRQIVFGPNAPQVTEEQWDQNQQRDDQNVIINTKDPPMQTYDDVVQNVDNDNSVDI
jgi:hypothetical protein